MVELTGHDSFLISGSFGSMPGVGLSIPLILGLQV